LVAKVRGEIGDQLEKVVRPKEKGVFCEEIKMERSLNIIKTIS
jgi:hypothetical protein